MVELERLLCSIKEGPMPFTIHGTVENTPLPGLQIEGVESPISLPLGRQKAREIVEKFDQNSQWAERKT